MKKPLLKKAMSELEQIEGLGIKLRKRIEEVFEEFDEKEQAKKRVLMFVRLFGGAVQKRTMEIIGLNEKEINNIYEEYYYKEGLKDLKKEGKEVKKDGKAENFLGGSSYR